MEPELPRVAVWISRVQLAAAGLVMLVAAVGGIGMQLEQLGPGALFDQSTYNKMLHWHWLAPLAIGAPSAAKPSQSASNPKAFPAPVGAPPPPQQAAKKKPAKKPDPTAEATAKPAKPAPATR